MMPWGIYPGRKIPALTWGLLVPSAKRGLRKDTMVDGWQPRRGRPSYHNPINTSRVASITSTMLGNYCQDTENYDTTHLLDMGTDAGVLFGYFDRVPVHCVHILQYIQILNNLFHRPYSAIYSDSEYFVS